MTQTNGSECHTETLPKGIVMIAGGGPVGLLLAIVLASYGVRSVVFERNISTTRWPKMDLTNPRSMEIFRRLGLSDGLRQLGVPAHIDQPVLVSSGLSAKEPITKWDLPSVNRFRKRILDNNDGTQPLEPWQRISQVIFEKWLKEICDEETLIDVRFGWKVEGVHEENHCVRSSVVNVDSGETITVISDYLAGCDGASSRTRKSLEFPLDGGPISACVLLVHFKSTDLARIQKQGQFWHIFLIGDPGELRGAIIAQNEVDTWTTHLFLPIETDTDAIGSEEAVYRVLGGLHGEYPIKIDEILVRSVWRPNIAIARQWASDRRRVFIAGDSAHQNIPTGGYGMNMGIGDAYDLGWKLAAVINGYAGKGLLTSYEEERRPVALRNAERSGVHFNVHGHLKELLGGGDPRRVDDDSEEGRAVRLRIHDFYQLHDGENRDLGIEIGYRYKSSVIVPDEDGLEPEWLPSPYIPSTWPGARPPHIFLSDGTAIFDCFGKDWTLLSFSAHDCGGDFLIRAAEHYKVPLKSVVLAGENLAETLYQKTLLLVRPDQHVAWRGDYVASMVDAEEIIRVVVGKTEVVTSIEVEPKLSSKPIEAFSSTTGLTTQVGGFTIERMGDFQK